jgi:hypothetical protein
LVPFQTIHVPTSRRYLLFFHITIFKSYYLLEVPMSKTSWLYVSQWPFSRLVGLGLCCHLVSRCLFRDFTSSNLLSSTSLQPYLSLPLPLPLFLLPWPLAGLVVWIMNFFAKLTKIFLVLQLNSFIIQKRCNMFFLKYRAASLNLL